MKYQVLFSVKSKQINLVGLTFILLLQKNKNAGYFKIFPETSFYASCPTLTAAVGHIAFGRDVTSVHEFVCMSCS